MPSQLPDPYPSGLRCTERSNEIYWLVARGECAADPKAALLHVVLGARERPEEGLWRLSDLVGDVDAHQVPDDHGGIAHRFPRGVPLTVSEDGSRGADRADRAVPVAIVARNILAAEAEGGLAVSTQVMSEFLVAVRRLAAPIDGGRAIEIVRSVTASVEVRVPSVSDVVSAGKRILRDRLHHYDALVVESALSARYDGLLRARSS